MSLTAVTAIAQLHLPVLPFLFTLFATGTLIHGSSRSLQMVEGGLALTVR